MELRLVKQQGLGQLIQVSAEEGPSPQGSSPAFAGCQFGGDSDAWFSLGPEHALASRTSMDRDAEGARQGGGIRWVSSLAPELQHELLHMSDLELDALSSPETTSLRVERGDSTTTQTSAGQPSLSSRPPQAASGNREAITSGDRLVSEGLRDVGRRLSTEDSPFVTVQTTAAAAPVRSGGALPPSSRHAIALDRLARDMPHILGVRTWSQQVHDKELARIIREIKAEKLKGEGASSGGHDTETGAVESAHGDVEHALRNVTKLGVRKVALLAFSSYMLGLDAIPTPDRIFHLGVFAALGSAMLLMNSSAMHYVHDPTAVLLMQLGGAVLMVMAMKLQGVAIKLNPGREEAMAWAVNAFGFLGSVFCSMQTLRHSDPRWYTVLHYSEPLGVVLVDTMVHHHKEDSNVGVKSLMSILALLSWAVGYRYWLTGRLFPSNPRAGVWGAAWLTIKTLYLVHLKHIVSISKVLPWERVLYANTFAFVILMVSIVVWSSVFYLAEPFEISTIVDLSKLTGESLGVVWASAICGTWLCLSRIVLLEQFSVREYALFSVIALAPARLLQAVPWQQSTA